MVAHAYLFAGPRGVGKRLTAMELAKSLNCLQPQADGGPCDACRSCRKIDADPPIHPDVILVEPEGRFIKTEQMRAVQTEVYARPSEGKARVVIVNGAERLNAEAGNRLLKVLEEPPSYAKFVLLTTNLAGVLPTIVSRCQIVHFSPLTTEAVAAIIQQRAELGADQARLFAALSGGSVGAAMEMASSPEVIQRRDDALEMLLRIGDMDDAVLLEQAEALEKQKDSLEARLDMVMAWLRDGLLLSQGASERLVMNADRMGDVRRLSARYGGSGLLAMLEAVTLARGQLLRNANARLTMDVLVFHLHRAAQSR